MNARITESSKQQRKIYISHKIAIVFAIQAILVLAILIFNSQIITSFNQSFKRMINSDTPKVVHSLQMVSAVYEVQQWLTDVSATADSAGYEDAEAWKKTFKSELASLRKLEKQENDSSIENSLIEADTNFDKLYATGYRMSQAYIQDGRNAGNLIMEDFDSDSTKLAESIDKIKTHYLNKQKNFAESITQNSETQSLWSRLLACALTIIFGIIVFLLVKSINKDVIEPIQKVIDGFTQVEKGDLDLSLTIRGTAEVTELGEAFNRCVLRLKEAREKENLLAQESNQLLNEAVRFKQMIENMPTNIILADTDGIITYLNPSSQKTLVGLANLLPIPVEKMQGQNIDVFHRNPKRVRSILSDLNNLPYAATIEFGGEKLDLLVSALYDANKEFAGLMLTWAVVTAMHKAKERDELVKTELNHTIHALEQSSSGLETNSCVLSSNMTQIASNSEQVQNYVNSVSVATEEMISSIAEISKNTERAAQMTKNVVHQMISTEDVIKNLQKQSEEISSILEVVTEIANQTNLLALNATIEAARAGDAGKGFAVVASEVKALATRTTEATEDINHKILAMQAESRNALTSIETATSAVKSIDEVAVTIAGSVEEQTAVTSEIGRSMRSSSEKVEEMASGISNITGLVFSNNEKVGDIKTVTQKLVELV